MAKTEAQEKLTQANAARKAAKTALDEAKDAQSKANEAVKAAGDGDAKEAAQNTAKEAADLAEAAQKSYNASSDAAKAAKKVVDDEKAESETGDSDVEFHEFTVAKGKSVSCGKKNIKSDGDPITPDDIPLGRDRLLELVDRGLVDQNKK